MGLQAERRMNFPRKKKTTNNQNQQKTQNPIDQIPLS